MKYLFTSKEGPFRSFLVIGQMSESDAVECLEHFAQDCEIREQYDITEIPAELEIVE